MQNKIKRTEKATLKTFQKEIPSNYFFKKKSKEYLRFIKNVEFMYKYNLKLPPEVFKGKKLIDFGAGTGENTIYLANWGAKCTLVEMNPIAHNISKKVFKKYSKSFKDHKFINSSIFDVKFKKNFYDIVHCRGVLSHTSAKEVAFKKISSALKKGGLMIFGDPNKSGGFQNMLQRFAVYNFSNNDEDMVKVSEFLFKEDIDRSYAAVKRTRREIIFDRWVIQSQDDPSISEVIDWMKKSDLKLYSSYPQLPNFYNIDSQYHKKITSIEGFKNILSLSEYLWMTHTEDDYKFLPKINKSMSSFSNSLQKLASYVANCNVNTKIDLPTFKKRTSSMTKEIKNLNILNISNKKSEIFLKESFEFINLTKKGDLNKLKSFVKKTKYLFKDAVGIRHTDYVAYKIR